MGQALYRKHRPRTLKEVVGQEHITNTLSQALKQGRISHAYLFTGPRGVGKTSIARIWAHQINGLPYTDDGAHLDIIEIDAASNRRIDEIRELRERVYMAPTSAKYKVYIIDEVHMLTREAFNALLKTLEEPPAHVVFILATTDAHKLPDTIISRTQRFSFRPAEPTQLAAHLQQLAQTENIKISDDALTLLAAHGAGSFRDSISLLDQASNQDAQVSRESVEQLLGIPPVEALDQLWQIILKGGSSAELMRSLNSLYDQGYQASTIASQLGQRARSRLVEAVTDSEAEQLLAVLAQLIEVPAAHDPERFLEVALLGARSQPAPVTLPSTPEPESGSEPLLEEPPESDEIAEPPASPQTAFGPDIWPALLQTLKQRHNTLYGVVRMAEPDFSQPGQLQLAFAFAFHQNRITENSNQQKLSDIIQELTGEAVQIICHLDKGATPPKQAVATTPPPSSNDLTAISNIFGNAELLES